MPKSNKAPLPAQQEASVEVIERKFHTNQTVKMDKELSGTIDGYWAGQIQACVVRIEQESITKSGEAYLKQFKCLTPNDKASRLYIIPEKELVRQNEQKRQVAQDPQKRTSKTKK